MATAAAAGSRGRRAEDLSAGRRWLAFAYLMVAEFFYGWSWNTVDVLRPQIREQLGLTLTQAGSLYTAQSIGAMVGAIGFGMLADRVGRQRTLFWVIAGYAVFGGLGAVVQDYYQAMGQRFMLGIFLGAIFPVLIATYMGLFPDGMRGKLAALGQGTYNLSVILLGQAYRHYADGQDWHVILWAGAIPPLLIAPLIFFFVPDDRGYRAWGTEAVKQAGAKLPIVELFHPRLVRVTVLLFLLTGCNFFGYQAFAGWVTTFLKETKQFDANLAGDIVSWQFIGAVAGGFFWGWFSDRFGRRPSAIGFFLGAATVLWYLNAEQHYFEFLGHRYSTLHLLGAAWGFMITASVAWAPWMTVLFPAHLRSTAMSIFNWGRIISMTAPLVTGWVADKSGLEAAMLLSAVGFGLGGIIWLFLPERLSEERV